MFSLLVHAEKFFASADLASSSLNNTEDSVEAAAAVEVSSPILTDTCDIEEEELCHIWPSASTVPPSSSRFVAFKTIEAEDQDEDDDGFISISTTSENESPLSSNCGESPFLQPLFRVLSFPFLRVYQVHFNSHFLVTQQKQHDHQPSPRVHPLPQFP